MDLLRPQRVLGLAAASSLDSVCAAVIETDGIDVFGYGPVIEVPCEDTLRERLHYASRRRQEVMSADMAALEQDVTDFYAEVIGGLIKDYDEKPDVIGFQGHIIAYNPDDKTLCELGLGQRLADLTGIKTVGRFGRADILAGGQGAPLSAVYHQALAQTMEKPAAIADIGGIASVTWIGANGEVMAFDAGPGMIAVNDWVFKHGGQHMDYNGKLAALGETQMPVLKQLMRHKFLAKYPPKAAGTETFNDKLEHLEGLSLNDGAATATSFIAESVAYSMALYLPEQPKILVVCGSGAENPTLLRFLRQRFAATEVKTAAEMGWNTTAIEAQAFGFLAMRRINMMPSTYPFTTGVYEPCICGEVFEPKCKE